MGYIGDDDELEEITLIPLEEPAQAPAETPVAPEPVPQEVPA